MYSIRIANLASAVIGVIFFSLISRLHHATILPTNDKQFGRSTTRAYQRGIKLSVSVPLISHLSAIPLLETGVTPFFLSFSYFLVFREFFAPSRHSSGIIKEVNNEQQDLDNERKLAFVFRM